MILQGLPKHRRHVQPLRVWRTETLGPPKEDTVINPVLSGRTWLALRSTDLRI